MSLRHFTKHLRGSAPIFPQIDELEIDSSYPCIIELVSLTISLPSLPGARWSTEVVEFELGCRRGVEGASSRAARRHVATVEGATPPSSRPRTVPPTSPLPLCPLSHLHRSRGTPKPPPAHRVRARSAPPERAWSTPRPSPHLEQARLAATLSPLLPCTSTP